MRDPIVQPSAEPVSLREARIHLRQLGDSPSYLGDSPAGWDPEPDDSWVKAKITVARQMAEDFLGYSLTDAVYVLPFDSFSPSSLSWYGPTTWGMGRMAGITIPYGCHVVAVQYLDPGNVLRTLGSTTYYADPFSGMLFVDTPPQLSSRPSPVRVQYRGPYGGTDSPSLKVPEIIKHAILMLVADWNENREDSVMDVRATTAIAKNGFEAMLRPHRIRLGMA